MSRPQRTLATAAQFAGVGIHTGQTSRMRVLPAEPGSGRVFVRQGVEIPALVSSLIRLERCTTLGRGEQTVSTVEHFLSAAAGLQLDNLRIEIDGPEVPILDGSARPFVQGLLAAGCVEQAEPAQVLVLGRPVFVQAGQALVVALPAAEACLEYSLHYQHPQITYQSVAYRPDPWRYEHELAPARTYGFWEEVQDLLERGLARGGDASNALVIKPDGYTSELRFPDEPVRHKCLDLQGDLALLGRDLQARVLALMAGHRLHIELVLKILKEEEEHHAGR